MDQVEIEEVASFCFLEAIIENEGGCKKEIPQRVRLGRVATQALRKTWKNKRMSKLAKNEN